MVGLSPTELMPCPAHIKKSVSSISALFSFGTGMILLLVLILFIGTFGVLAQDGGSNSEIISLNEEVIAYEDTIRKYAKENDIEDYVSLIQAIMMQESGGKGNDQMQASESGYNTKFPRVPNGITEAEYSIEVGVKTFSDCIKKANVKDPSDTEHIYLALQGYNYGNGYIEWALTNFGGYSKYNAQLFSDNKKQELHVNGYGDPLYVDHVMRYVGITFRGGTNPNFNNLEAWVTKKIHMQKQVYMANAHGLRGVDSMNYTVMIQVLLVMDGIVSMNYLLLIVINLKERIRQKQVQSFQALVKTMLELCLKLMEKT